jgi:hypothetical protein
VFYEKASGRRGLRVEAGEGAVTPTRPVTVEYRDGSREQLIPGRHRFAPDHGLVRQRPELFQLCCKDDRTTAPRVFRDALRAAERALTRPPSGAAPRSRLRRKGREPWRLGSDLRSDRLSRRDPRGRYGRHQIRRDRYQ